MIITIIILILIAIASVITYNIVIENGKNYEIEQVKQYNYFILKQNDLYGVIDRKGDVIITPEYSEIKIANPEKGVFICYQGGNTKILNEKKEEILTQYSDVQPIRLKNIASDYRIYYNKYDPKWEHPGESL